MSLSFRHFAAASGAALLLAAGAGKVLAQDNPLPDGPGKTELMQTCTLCHAIDAVTQRHRSPDEWVTTVNRMQGMGAQMDDAQKATILAYLNTNLGTGPAPASAAAPATTAAPATPATSAAPGTPATPATPPAGDTSPPK
jgi:Quinohemoprotein amine dehydrogenase A, alpha subunit, haem binding